ncbi:unnamed protein product, partial [Brassica oleracea]
RETTTESILAELERGRMRRDKGKEGNRERGGETAGSGGGRETTGGHHRLRTAVN